MGLRIQSTAIDRQCLVRGGFSLEDARKRLSGDIEGVKDNTVIILGYGLNDIESGNIRATTRKMEQLIDTAEWDNATGRVKVAVLPLPPQKDFKRNKCIEAVNEALRDKVKKSNVSLIDCSLSLDDLGRDGMHTNNRGKDKIAAKIRLFSLQASQHRV